MKDMREAIRDLNLWHQTQLTLQDIAQKLNPLLRGWIAYYGRYARSMLGPVFWYVNQKLRAWVMRKFKRFKHHPIQASEFLRKLAETRVDLFVHWSIDRKGEFA
jgi:RNA-directed DNA polymerase